MKNPDIGEKTNVKETDEQGFSGLPEEKGGSGAGVGFGRSRREIEEIAREIETNLRKLK